MAAAAAPGCEIQYIQQYNSSDSEAASDNWESESWNMKLRLAVNNRARTERVACTNMVLKYKTRLLININIV